jgi:hypothetical protein
MASYVVLEPPGSGGEKSAEAKFVRDGFFFPALIIPVFWMLWHRMWLEAGLVFLATAIFGALADRTEMGMLGIALSLGLAVFTGFEGAALRIASLRRKGWTETAVVEAQSAADAELRYLYDSDEPEPPLPEPALRPSPTGAPVTPTGPALGLMSYPGHR